MRQALPDVKRAARRWFGSDHGALARLLGLDGPITESPVRSSRTLPDDMAALQREVADWMVARAAPSDDQSGGHYVPTRLAPQAVSVLIAWQASGAVPPRKVVFGSDYGWVFEQTFGCDLDQGYRLLLDAIREALERRGHPAAVDMVLD